MKKYFIILMALIALGFTQCKPTPEGGDDNTNKVKVVCEIPINKGGRSDFTNLLENGSINWSNGSECVYLAIHGSNPQMIRLENFAQGNPAVLTFEGEVAAGLIQEDEEYDVWYFGHSHQQPSSTTYKFENNTITGSIATQSGRLETLGYNHIAKASVIPTLTNGNGDVKLSLIGTLRNQIAILLLDLENVDELYGDAIIGTDYVLAYNSESDRFEIDVTEDPYAKIKVERAKGLSYIAVFPNAEENTEIRYEEKTSSNQDAKNYKVYECIIYDEIKASNLYYHTAPDGVTKLALPWSVISSGDVVHGDGDDIHYHHYVDLGLPSGTLWATKNIGADTLYDYGDYFSWGEIAPKDSYKINNSKTYNKEMNVLLPDSNGDISGNPAYDAATAIWGPEWKIPTHEEQMELYTKCKFEPMKTSHGTNGYLVTGPNGNYIFLPAAGYRDGEYGTGEQAGNYFGHYWSSTPAEWHGESILLHFEKAYSLSPYYALRYYGCSIRPVLVKKADEMDHDDCKK
ncbi:MAG: hypothetical protein IKU01_01380 [Bacteroidales bacterium]|nr:hypothetical protein [Bacteroidales bacterium]